MIDHKIEQEKPVAEVLSNIQVELLELGQMLARLQTTFSPLLHTAACTNEFYRDVQSLDLAAQQVQGLTVVIGNLASVVSPKWRVAPEDIVATLVIQTLANRICGEYTENGDEVRLDFELL